MMAQNTGLSLAPLRTYGFGILLLVSGFGCAQNDGLQSGNAALGESGRWRAPAHILADGDTQNVEYTGAGPWVDEATSCQGTFTAGGQFLKEYLLEYFPQVHQIGGYSCRPIVGNPSQASVHSTGRALDLMIRTTGDDADNDLGDPVAHWLMQNAERMGIQFIIWDRTTWMAARGSGQKEREYGGPNPHIDHLHIELSPAGGRQEPPWYSEDWAPPVLDACPALPAEGGIIDDEHSCMQLLGASQFWRIEEGVGFENRLAWTNATSRDEPSNWARWQIVLGEAGQYKVEIFADAGYSEHSKARYELSHNEQSQEFIVDQSQLSGWHELGEFEFAVGGGQELRLFDNSSGEVAANVRISADAIRLTKIQVDGPDGPDAPDAHTSGCALAGGTPAKNSLLPILLVGLAGLLRRRRRR